MWGRWLSPYGGYRYGHRDASGNKCPEKGQHWCQDCLVAEPIITQEVAKCSAKRMTTSASPLVLVTCAVCPNFMKPTSPYRMNPDIQLTSVPCLIR